METKIIAGITIILMSTIAAVASGYCWYTAMTLEVPWDRAAYSDAGYAMLVLGLMTVYPFFSVLLDLARNARR